MLKMSRHRESEGETMKPSWQLMAHWSHPRKHVLVYRDNSLGCQMEVHTPVRGKEPVERFGKARRYWFIDGFEDRYRSEEAMIEALKWLKEHT